MKNNDYAQRIEKLAKNAASIAEMIQSSGGPPEETREAARRLRATLAVALLQSERLAREAGNEQMIEFEKGPDWTREVQFTINLDAENIEETGEEGFLVS